MLRFIESPSCSSSERRGCVQHSQARCAPDRPQRSTLASWGKLCWPGDSWFKSSVSTTSCSRHAKGTSAYRLCTSQTPPELSPHTHTHILHMPNPNIAIPVFMFVQLCDAVSHQHFSTLSFRSSPKPSNATLPPFVIITVSCTGYDNYKYTKHMKRKRLKETMMAFYSEIHTLMLPA